MTWSKDHPAVRHQARKYYAEILARAPAAALAAYQAAMAGRAPARTAASYVFRDSTGRELKRPAIQGWACLSERVFDHRGQLCYFKVDAFAGVRGGQAKQLCFDHKVGRSYGGTASGLEFANTAKGLAFRMPLVGADGRTVHENVMAGDRACVSVGCNIEESEIRNVRGHDVKIVSRATLEEISLVKEGAVPTTAAWIVDLDEEEPDLWTAARSNLFGMAKAAANAQAAAKRIADNLARGWPPEQGV